MSGKRKINCERSTALVLYQPGNLALACFTWLDNKKSSIVNGTNCLVILAYQRRNMSSMNANGNGGKNLRSLRAGEINPNFSSLSIMPVVVYSNPDISKKSILKENRGKAGIYR